MANGDEAAAEGMAVVSGDADRRMGYDEINLTRDYVAREINLRELGDANRAPKVHQHDAADVNTGVLATGRIPDLSASKITSGTLSNSRLGSDLGDRAIDRANGPTYEAYNRNAAGSGWYAVYMNSSYQFMRNTSSRRYKEDVQDLDPIHARRVLDLQPRTYHRKGQPPGSREVGLIAEECVDVPGLVTWDVPRRMDGQPVKGANPRPEAVRYETVLPVYLLAVIQGQARELADLRARVEALEHDQ